MTPADEILIPLIEAATAESRHHADDWIACRAGCSDCCHAAFAITALDAARLREGMAALPRERREAIAARARDYAGAVRDTFPGDWQTGLLDRSDEWRDWFFARQRGRACPALDPSTGCCELYEHRPVACRLHGHLIRIGAHGTPVCHLCFHGASAEQQEACRVTLALPEGEAGGETIVALALSY